MKQHESPEGESIEEAAYRQKIEALFQRRSALTEDERALFQGHYDVFFDEHYDMVCAVVRWRGIHGTALDDQVQDCFISFFFGAVAAGFPESIEGKLCSIASGNVSNLRRAEEASPLTTGMPSSRSEPAQSSLRGPERRMDLERIRRVLPALSAEQRAAVEAFYFEDKTQEKAAEDLGISREALVNRLERAKRRLEALLAYIPESQRGTP